MNKDKKFGAFLGFSFMTLIALLVVFLVVFIATFFIGGGLLNILGFKYYSIMDVMKFFLIYLFISFITDSISRGFTGALESVQVLNGVVTNIIKFIILVGTDIVALSMAESMVSGIFIKDETMIIFAIICYIGESLMDRQLNKGDEVKDA